MLQLPLDLPEKLAQFLTRQITDLESKINGATVQKLTALPTRPVIGKQYYFKNAIAPTITGEGLWLYKSTGWVQLG